MLVANSFDSWQRDAFFSAAEEVQRSADNLEFAYRTWVSEKRKDIASSFSDQLLRELQSALGTAKWQLEEFERAVRLSYGTCRDQNGMARHQQFIVAIESQISRVEDALRESLEEEGKEPLRWVNLNAAERDDLAIFLFGTREELTKSVLDESLKSSACSNMENVYKGEDLDYAACSSGSSVEANVQAKGLTSIGDDVVINIGPPDCDIEQASTRGDFFCEADRVSSTKRTWVSPKYSMLRIIVPNEADQMSRMLSVEATPKEKGTRTSSYLQFRVMNCINKILRASIVLKSNIQSHRRFQFSSSKRTIILMTILFFLLVLYFVH